MDAGLSRTTEYIFLWFKLPILLRGHGSHVDRLQCATRTTARRASVSSSHVVMLMRCVQGQRLRFSEASGSDVSMREKLGHGPRVNGISIV